MAPHARKKKVRDNSPAFPAIPAFCSSARKRRMPNEICTVPQMAACVDDLSSKLDLVLTFRFVLRRVRGIGEHCNGPGSAWEYALSASGSHQYILDPWSFSLQSVKILIRRLMTRIRSSRYVSRGPCGSVSPPRNANRRFDKSLSERARKKLHCAM